MNVYDIALDFVLQSVGNKSKVDKTQHNIGQFFKHIRNSIVALGDDIFCKDFKDKEECKIGNSTGPGTCMQILCTKSLM